MLFCLLRFAICCHLLLLLQAVSILGMESLPVLPLHKYPQYMQQCCDLLNAEWKRSNTARLRSLESSCDTLPISLILIEHNKVIGHCRLSPIPSIQGSCFVESVVIDNTLRGKGYGSYLMKRSEEFCQQMGLKIIYLSTKGQEKFYSKLGYEICPPVNIFGAYTPAAPTPNFCLPNYSCGPKPPPLPSVKNNSAIIVPQKVFMSKYIDSD